MEEVAEVTSGINRRDFVKRSAIVGGLVWAAPMVNSFAAPAFAGTHEVTDLCPTDDQPSDLTWQYYHETNPCNRDPLENAQPGFDCEVHPTLEYPNGPAQITVQLTGQGNVLFQFTPVLNGTYGPFTVPGMAGSFQEIKVLDNLGNVLHRVKMHTSCSQPLRIGDRFGNFELIAGLPA